MTTQTGTPTLPEILALAGKNQVTAYLTLAYEPEAVQREMFAAIRAIAPDAVLASGRMPLDLTMTITLPAMTLLVVFDKRKVADEIRESARTVTAYVIGTEEF